MLGEAGGEKRLERMAWQKICRERIFCFFMREDGGDGGSRKGKMIERGGEAVGCGGGGGVGE